MYGKADIGQSLKSNFFYLHGVEVIVGFKTLTIYALRCPFVEAEADETNLISLFVVMKIRDYLQISLPKEFTARYSKYLSSFSSYFCISFSVYKSSVTIRKMNVFQHCLVLKVPL